MKDNPVEPLRWFTSLNPGRLLDNVDGGNNGKDARAAIHVGNADPEIAKVFQVLTQLGESVLVFISERPDGEFVVAHSDTFISLLPKC